MKNSFPQFLLEQGYKPYRKVFDRKVGEWNYVETSFKNDYSTMGHLDYRFMKEGKEIIWGLSEAGKPPTLIWPRPKGIDTDDLMNRMLLNTSNEEIYNAL